jgi:hypothetical protein
MDASLIVHGEFRSFIEQERQRVQRLSAQDRSAGASVDPSTTKPHDASEPPEFTVVPEALWRQLRGNMIFNEAWHHAELSDLSAHIRAASLGTAMCTFDGRRLFVQWTECGWPRTCLRSVHLRLSSLQVSDPHLPKDWQLKPTSYALPIELPLKPLWPGMLTNVACFTAAWFTLLFAARRLITHAIRLRRTRHNRCPACGYSLTGVTTNVCPECGDAISPQTRTAPAS